MLKGIPDDRDGLFDTIQRSKNHYQKRAYQCIKCMVALFSNCSVAYQILQVRCSEIKDYCPFLIETNLQLRCCSHLVRICFNIASNMF